MRIFEVAEENTKEVSGTNCANCSFIKGEKKVSLEEGELNKQGGIDPANDKEMERAQKGDLVTLPGTAKATFKIMCTHDKIQQYVTKRNCCAFWDNPGVYRPYGEKVVGE